MSPQLRSLLVSLLALVPLSSCGGPTCSSCEHNSATKEYEIYDPGSGQVYHSTPVCDRQDCQHEVGIRLSGIKGSRQQAGQMPLTATTRKVDLSGRQD